MSDLKPCPFCGSSDVGGASGIISCYRCPAEISVQNTNTHYAAELWNNRAARAQQPKLSRIAQKKLDQMGATVHGVLVKNGAGAWVAVSDAGRVMWLDGFEGQAARAQGGEAVAWLVDRPSPWKPKVFLSNSDALRFSDSRHDASKPLPLICPQPADGWIKCSELTLEHADERGEVWGLDDIGNVDLLKAGSLLDGWHSHLVAFRPTGLKRPNPPNEGAE